MKKLLAITHNYIGRNLKASLENGPMDVYRDHLAVVVSGDHLPLTKEAGGIEQAFRRQKLTVLYTLTLVNAQKPDILLLYIGMGDNGDCTMGLDFAQVAVDCCDSISAVHLVWPEEIANRMELYHQMARWVPTRGIIPVHHLAESTGNITMEKLIDEFLRDGSIKDPMLVR